MGDGLFTREVVVQLFLVGMAGAQPWRDTQRAAGVCITAGLLPSFHRSGIPAGPDIKASPAPRTFRTSTRTPLCIFTCDQSTAMLPSKTEQPSAPRSAHQYGPRQLTDAPQWRSASVLPPAIWNSSSVPTIRSKWRNTCWSCSVQSL
ncbi:hypothetical protein KCP78_22650 [Salmonella enterica subsp. enterica]|nr:hypothetical protein KCP78_22650 [Salmonella enterica subsp. enterica]